MVTIINKANNAIVIRRYRIKRSFPPAFVGIKEFFSRISIFTASKRHQMATVVVQEFPRSPSRSQPPSLRHMPSTQAPRSAPVKTAVLVTESYPTSSYENYGDDTGFEYKSKEKESYKEESSITVTEDSPVHKEKDCVKKHDNKKHDDKKHDDKKHKKSGCSGSTFAIILFVIFIIILFIALGGFWYCQPDFCSGETDGEKGFSFAAAGLYAFLIALFFVIVIGAAWYACS